MKGTLKQTKENDYKAGDGLWYPSNRLESYFKAPDKSYIDAIEALAALKEFYGSMAADLISKDNPFLKQIK